MGYFGGFITPLFVNYGDNPRNPTCSKKMGQARFSGVSNLIFSVTRLTVNETNIYPRRHLLITIIRNRVQFSSSWRFSIPAYSGIQFPAPFSQAKKKCGHSAEPEKKMKEESGCESIMPFFCHLPFYAISLAVVQETPITYLNCASI